MIKILEFLDFSSLDPQLYWKVKSLDGLNSFEIMWRRESTIRWRFRELGDLFWTLSETAMIANSLKKKNVDLVSFENQLNSSLLHQSCFAAGFLKECKEMLGDVVVEDAIVEHEEFLEQMVDVIKSFAPDETNGHNKSDRPKKGLSLVKTSL